MQPVQPGCGVEIFTELQAFPDSKWTVKPIPFSVSISYFLVV